MCRQKTLDKGQVLNYNSNTFLKSQILFVVRINIENELKQGFLCCCEPLMLLTFCNLLVNFDRLTLSLLNA